MVASYLNPGREVTLERLRLDRSLVQDYLDAVEDASGLYQTSALVPPTALAALAMRALLEGLELPPGTVHAAQELTARRAVSVGEEVSCRVRVAQASQRREWRFVVLEFAVADQRDRPVLEGRTTLMVPSPSG